MRSNGAVHIGNDTFVGTTRDVEENLFLFSSAFEPEERLAELPLSRRVRIVPKSALYCTANELDSYLSTTLADNNDAAASEAEKPLLLRHSAHASADGRKIAYISTVRRHHYIIDISVEPAKVCEFSLPELVRSVCWHTAHCNVLLLLFVSGDLGVIDTSLSHLGVVLPRKQYIYLKDAVQQCWSDAWEATYESGTTADPSPHSQKKASSSSSVAKGDTNHSGREAAETKTPHVESSLPLSVVHSRGGSPVPRDVISDAKTGELVRSSGPGTSKAPAGVVSRGVPIDGTRSLGKSRSTACVVYAPRNPDNGGSLRETSPPPTVFTTEERREVHVIVSEASDPIVVETRSYGGLDTADDDSSQLCIPESSTVKATSHLDLVDISIMEHTKSLPAILLVLSSGGDVYSVKLNELGLPTTTEPSEVDDGSLRGVGNSAIPVAAESETHPMEVHHLIAANLHLNNDEALAVRGYLADLDAGTHGVYFCTANGLLIGAWVTEPDLLAQHRATMVRQAGRPAMDFTIHLGPETPVRHALSPAVPTTAHTVTMTSSQNICLVRYGPSAAMSFLVAMPLWNYQQRRWTYWHPNCPDGRERSREARLLPPLGSGAQPTQPIALRLPYDTRDASLALGCRELLIMPEVSSFDDSQKTSKTNWQCLRSSMLTVSISALLRSALYAQCGPLEIHAPPSPTSTRSGPSAQKLIASKLQAVADGTSTSSATELLINSVPECHRRLLRGCPLADVDAATMTLAAMVEQQVNTLEQRELAVRRREATLRARLVKLESFVASTRNSLTESRRTLLDAVVHRRGASAVIAANERLGEVHDRLEELQQL